MVTETRHEGLKSLRIQASQRNADSDPSARKSRRFILIGVAVFVLLGTVVTLLRLLSTPVTAVQVTRPTPTTGGGAASGDTVLSAAGYIVAHHKIDVNSKVTGRVAWIGVEKGDHVRAGQVLVILEDQEFRAQVEQAHGSVASAAAHLKELENGSRPQEIQQAQANLEQAQADMIAAKASLDRIRALVKEGVFSKQQLDDAVARYDSSSKKVDSLEKAYQLSKVGPRQETIEGARGDLREAQGRLALAESQLEATKIRAPTDGTILERTAEKGELVTAQFASAADTGGPRGSVVSLADLNDLQAELDISQNDFARLSPKQQAVVSTDAYPDRKYSGIISEISPEANRQKATVQIKVKILNVDDYLRPEMNANVQFIAEQKAQDNGSDSRFTIPANAVKDANSRTKVLVAYKDHAVERDVSIVSRLSNSYVVEGLTGGEDIIVGAPPTLKNGDPIKIAK